MPQPKATDNQPCERSSSRFPSDPDSPPVTIETDDHYLLSGTLLNESKNGIAALISIGGMLILGQQITVTYFGGPMQAIVRYIQPTDLGGWRVGLQWVSSKR